MVHIGEDSDKAGLLVTNLGSSKAVELLRCGFEMDLEQDRFVKPKALDSFPGA